MRAKMILLGVLPLLAGCTESATVGGSRTSVYLTDSPFPFNNVQSVNVHVVRLEAARAVDTTLLALQAWTLIGEPNRTVNLLELQGGVTTLVGEADLPAGEYRAVRLTLDPAQSSVVSKDGHTIPVSWGATEPFAMYATVENPLPISGNGGRIVIDFDVGRSFRPMGSGLLFIPWLRAVNEDRTGSISGTIRIGDNSLPLQDAVVSAYRNTGLVATARTGADGKYRVAYLPGDKYQVVIEAPIPVGGTSAPCGKVENVQVSAGQTSNVDYLIPSASSPCNLPTNPDSSSGGGQTGGPVSSVSVTVSSAHSTIVVHDSLGFTAQLKDAAGVALYGREVQWTSSNPDVLPIEWSYGSFAIARAKKTGSATVTATSEGKSGTRVVNVQ